MRERRERVRLTVSETTGAVRESSQQTETGSVVKNFCRVGPKQGSLSSARHLDRISPPEIAPRSVRAGRDVLHIFLALE